MDKHNTDLAAQTGLSNNFECVMRSIYSKDYYSRQQHTVIQMLSGFKEAPVPVGKSPPFSKRDSVKQKYVRMNTN